MKQVSYFVLCTLLLTSSGCGKKLQLNVQPAQGEVGQPTADLVRSVNVTYTNPSGREEFRKAIPTLSLNQPLKASEDFLKDVNWEKGGTWSAIGYSGDGLALLAGSAQPDPNNTKVIELTLGRAASATALVSPFLRAVKVYGPGRVTLAIASAVDLKKGSKKNQCVNLHEFTQNPAQGIYPTLEIQSSIKAPMFWYEVTDQGHARNGTKLAEIEVSSSGTAELALNANFIDGELARKDSTIDIHLYSGPAKEYEGCVTIESKLSTTSLQVAFVPGDADPNTGSRSSYMKIHNPNKVPYTAHVSGSVGNGAETMIPLASLSGGGIGPMPSKSFSFNLTINPDQDGIVYILGGRATRSATRHFENPRSHEAYDWQDSYPVTLVHGISVSWTMTTTPDSGTQTGSGFIP